MSTDERIRMLEAKLDALLISAITYNNDTAQAINSVAPNPVPDRVAVALDLIANEGKQMIAQKVVKKRRKASAYGRRYGAAYKRLRKKHPRAKHTTLVKRAHAEARRGKKK